MKRKLIAILMTALLCFAWSTCLATSEDIAVDDSEVYVDNYEDYEQIMNDVNSEYSQDELEEYYDSYQEYMAAYYNEYQREETVKARVIEVEEVEEQYEFDQYYYSVSKYEIQPITVEILEGEHIGEQFNINYLLTGDSLNNIRYSELKKGDTIFVGFYTDSTTGETYADITNTGSNVERFSVIICIGIIAACLLMVYGRKKGLLTTLIILLALDFCLVIIPNMGFAGQGFVIGGILFILLLIVTISVMKLGLNIKTLLATIISIFVTAIAFLLLLIADYLTRTVGVTFEVAAIAENVLLGNMNFEHLYIIVTMIIASMAITNVACKSIEKMQATQTKGFNDRMEACKGCLDETALSTVITLLACYIPNHLLLLTNKYTTAEILNSEILVSELIRIFIVLIAIALTVPAIAAVMDEKKEEK